MTSFNLIMIIENECCNYFSSMNVASAFHMQKQWTELFPWNIGSASILDIISPGIAGSKNGMLQLVCYSYLSTTSSKKKGGDK